jgi:transcriptional regulator with XRE-family HTH domain
MTPNRIRQLTPRRGDLSRLAVRSGVNVSMLSGYARGTRTPAQDTATRIAAALGEPPETVFPTFATLRPPVLNRPRATR